MASRLQSFQLPSRVRLPAPSPSSASSRPAAPPCTPVQLPTRVLRVSPPSSRQPRLSANPSHSYASRPQECQPLYRTRPSTAQARYPPRRPSQRPSRLRTRRATTRDPRWRATILSSPSLLRLWRSASPAEWRTNWTRRLDWEGRGGISLQTRLVRLRVQTRRVSLSPTLPTRSSVPSLRCNSVKRRTDPHSRTTRSRALRRRGGGCPRRPSR